MKIIKEIFRIFIDPLKVIGNKNSAEYLAKFFEKYHFLIYILAFLTCFTLFLIFDQFDSFIEFFKTL